MVLKIQAQDRKTFVKQLIDLTGETCHYLGFPSKAFQIGPYRVGADMTLSFEEDVKGVVPDLISRGLLKDSKIIAMPMATEVPEAEEAEQEAETEADTEDADQEETEPEGVQEEAAADSEVPEQEEPAAEVTEPEQEEETETEEQGQTETAEAEDTDQGAAESEVADQEIDAVEVYETEAHEAETHTDEIHQPYAETCSSAAHSEGAHQPEAETENAETHYEESHQPDPHTDSMIIRFPLSSYSGATLRNLIYTFYSREDLLNLATRGHFHVSDEFVQVLKDDECVRNAENFMAAREAFEKTNGPAMKGIEITDSEVIIKGFGKAASVTEERAFWQLAEVLNHYAITSKKVLPKKSARYESDKYSVRCMLLQIGMIGAEYSEARKTILKPLSGPSSFQSENMYARWQADNARAKLERRMEKNRKWQHDPATNRKDV